MTDLPAVDESSLDGRLLRPVGERNPFEDTVERLVQMIKLGMVPVGDRFPPERDLASRLQVSRVTLRSAIRALQQAGYVESRVGRGGGNFVVWRPDVSLGNAKAIARSMGDGLRDALTFRSVIEPGAAGLAASAELTKVDRRELSACADAVSAARMEDYRLADARLHIAIARTSGSASLVSAVAEVQMRLSDLLQAIPRIEEALNHSNDQHTQILDAIFGADPAGARAAMEAHIDATAALVTGFLEPTTHTDRRSR